MNSFSYATELKKTITLLKEQFEGDVKPGYIIKNVQINGLRG